MSGIFSGCSSLTSLDVSNWDTSSVIDMSGVFNSCSKLTTLDVSNWDTSKVTIMNNMFQNCSKLIYLDLSNFNTSSVTNIASMFYNCSALESLDVSGFTMTPETSTNSIFNGCSNLTTLKIPIWYTSLFLSQSSKLTSESLKDLLANLATVTNGQTLTLGSTNLAKVSTADILGAQLKGWTVDGASSTAVVFASDTISGDDTVTECAIQLTQSNKNTRIDEVLGAYTACTAIYLFEDGSVIDLSSLFHNNNSTYKSRLTKIDILSGNFRNVTEAYATFNGCSNLTSLNLSGWDTSSVTDISWIFESCPSLVSIDVSNWDTSSVTTMAGMFYGCSSLTSLDLSNWDTSSVTDINRMFQGCSKLTSLDLSSFDVSKVTTMGATFKGCSTLEDLDISTWKFDSLEIAGGNGTGMFYECKKLKSDKFPVFDIPKVTIASRMFFDCQAITELHFRNAGGIQEMNDGYSNGAFIYSGSVVKVTGIDFSGLVYDATTYISIDMWAPIEEFTITGNIYKSIYIKMDNAPYNIVKGILNALADVGDDTKTLVLAQNSIKLLSDSDIIEANNKGWTITTK